VELVPNDEHQHTANLLFKVCTQTGKHVKVVHTDNVGKDRHLFQQLYQRITVERQRQQLSVDPLAELLVM
jgi:hypothetical protein